MPKLSPAMEGAMEKLTLWTDTYLLRMKWGINLRTLNALLNRGLVERRWHEDRMRGLRYWEYRRKSEAQD